MHYLINSANYWCSLCYQNDYYLEYYSAVPLQYRWLSEGPNGLSIASNQIKKVEKNENSKGN